MSDVGSQQAAGNSEKDYVADFDENNEEETAGVAGAKELNKMFRQKYSKYLPYIKGDLEFNEGHSVAITLQFPLEYKKLLILQQADSALK